jgi:uncharacterized protein (TIGR02145 family)
VYYARPYAITESAVTYGSVVTFRTNARTVTDYDGNIYHVAKIGNQEWFTENLKVTHFRNGDPITYIEDATAWNLVASGAWCYYEKDPNVVPDYGNLYNFYAVNDSRNICPEGWHVPTAADWNELISYLGGNQVAGEKMKEKGSDHWMDTNNGTNESGFTALPGGYRFNDGTYQKIREIGTWWSSDESDSNPQMASYIFIYSEYSSVSMEILYKNVGLSVRCVRDR